METKCEVLVLYFTESSLRLQKVSMRACYIVMYHGFNSMIILSVNQQLTVIISPDEYQEYTGFRPPRYIFPALVSKVNGIQISLALT